MQTFTSPSQRITLPKKIALENTFIPEIKAYFNTIRKDFESFYKSSGQVISMDEYSDITLALIKKHYNRVAKVFKRDLRGNTKQQETQEEAEDNLINAAIVAFILLKAKISADLIKETNINQIRESIIKAKKILIDAGKELNNRSISNEASKILMEKFDARTETIAISETQFIAESTKSIEANVISGQQPFDGFAAPAIVTGIIVKKSTKTWETTLDEKTRISHALADRQTIPIMQPFIVGGERLKYPRDTSLGASAKNVINCRCESVYNIVRELI